MGDSAKMRGLAVGDMLLPTEKMTDMFGVDGVKEHVSEVRTTEFKNENRSDIRRTMRKVEQNGPDAEPPPEDMADLIGDASILAIHICPLSGEMLKKAKNLRIIATARGGVENIDLKEATRRKIAVINTPNHNAQAVAEYAIGLMLAETRNIARSYRSLREGEWREYYANTEHIPELNGSTVGIVGFGQNGRLVVEKLRSFEVNILVYDPFVPEEEIESAGASPAEFDRVLGESDIVSLHVRLTPETREMMTEKEFKKMKSSAYLINTARAGLIRLDDFARALRERWISGAAVDVYESEPVSPDYPLFRLDNVTFTNHRAGDTRNAYWKAPLIMGDQVARLLRGERPRFLINAEILEATSFRRS